MEIIRKFERNGYFTCDLYHLLAKKGTVESDEDIIPSEYAREMRMDSVERIQNLNNMYVDNRVGEKPEQIVLAFTPKLLVFQNFKPNDKIIAKFSVKNISKAPVFLNMVFKESSYFTVKLSVGQLLSRLAPGISVTFSVTFLPLQYEDYVHRVTFQTDKDKYVLPLIAMGPRPIFDYPNEIVLQATPLKVECNKVVTVRNIGVVAAGFTLKTKCPFSVHPKSAYLLPDEKVEIKVMFKTMRLGQTEGVLYAVFETGERFRIKLSGTTYVVDIELEKDVVRFQDTYNSMVRQQTFKIKNKSNHLLSYMCMRNNCVYYDFVDKLKLANECYDLKENEVDKCRKLEEYDVLSSEENERIYMRLFQDEIHSIIADETLYFENIHFSITPVKGNLWPNKETELTVTFNPQVIREFEAVAYLDIDGVEDRLPLRMMGTSLPPSIHLNLETLDMDSVYINKTYNYEIVAVNKGHINGVIVYKEIPTLFGSQITCTPEMHRLRPGDKEIFVISFCNPNQGPYFEEINFTIRETTVVLKLYLKGEVIYPSLSFSLPCLDFGHISLGIPETMEFFVLNESVVQVKGNVKIASDGPEISSITLQDYAVADMPKPAIPQWPKEFYIEPCKVDIDSESTIPLKVTLTANLMRANQTFLELEIEKSDSAPILLPVRYNAMVPEITPAADIEMRACFLDYTYRTEIVISSSGFWGYFTIEDSQENSPLDVEVSIKEGLIEPNSMLSLPVTIRTQMLGIQEYNVRISLFGLSRSINICHITVCGVRPIVTCTPVALHWGQVKLLTKSQKTLTLFNDSPVQVNFKASVLNRDGRWQIQPNEGFIEPEAEIDLTLALYLLDADSYTNKALIQMENVNDILVPLTATGVGTSIVVGDFKDRIYLGRHFTNIPLSAKVIMENFGTRTHSLEWNEHFKPPKTKPLTSTFFTLDPKLFKIAAGEKIELTLSGISHKMTTVKEIWYLVGSVEGVNKKEMLLECPVVAEFVDPKIELSTSLIEFQYDISPYNEYYKLTDIVTIRNISKLPLEVEISVKQPFALVKKSDTYKVTHEDENMCCCIKYREGDLNLKNIRRDSSAEQVQSYIDYLTMKPIEPSRKSPLNFFENIHKIKMAFNLTSTVEEQLEDLETMKVQIVFDTTRHSTLKSKTYFDLMRVKFKGHRNKDAVKVVGKINFPNILVLSPKIDFQCVLNGSIEGKTIKIQNVTPLIVCYRFNWKRFSITHSPPSNVIPTDTEALLSDVTEVNTSTLNVVEPTLHDKQEMMNPSQEGSFKKTYDENEQAIETILPTFDNNTRIRAIDLKTDKSFEQKIIQTISPMLDIEYENKFEWFYKIPKISKTETSINDMLYLTPHRGVLKPNEIQYIHIIFRPSLNVSVKATLECDVLGGPSESVTVLGQSSDLLYNINTKRINFKIRSFHESASEKLIITNIAQLPFEFKTYMNESKIHNLLEAKILDVEPSEKIVEPEEQTEVNINVRPGVVGYFHRMFLLEIGHNPPIPIEVFGWGTIPQVYLTLSRPQMIHLNPVYGYMAIPFITEEYMEAVKEIFKTNCSNEHLNSPRSERCFEDPIFKDGWHIICPAWDSYPSIIDIELAIERILVIDHIKSRPDILHTYCNSSKMIPITGFRTIPYVIDYGVVITGSTVYRIAEVINYGPIVTRLRIVRGTEIPKWMNVRVFGKLDPGESGKLEVSFSPTASDFTETEQNVEISFQLEVPYGVTIPVHMKALCAVPYLATNVSFVNLGTVRCGDKIITSIPLKNIGKPTCVWYVTLKLKVPGPSPMTIIDSSGIYEPGQDGWLSIAFRPIMEMTYEGMLVFRFHMNPNKMLIPLIGRGVSQQVHVIGPNVVFPPTLPWAETADIFFGLTNPCSFPIELIIAHSDKKRHIEDEIFQLLYKYYNKPEEMVVPSMKPGNALPPEITNFYFKFQENVKRAIFEEASAGKSVLSSRPLTSARKSARNTKNVGKSGTAPLKEQGVRKFRTEAEIITDEIKKLKEDKVDPLKECLHVFDEMSTEVPSNNHTKGLIVAFHGSPCEESQCKEMSYSLGMRLGIPTVNVDLCIVEALCISNSSAKVTIMNAVNDIFDTALNKDFRSGDNLEEIFEETLDDFEMVWKKIFFLIENKSYLTTSRIKAGDKKKKRSSMSSNTSQTHVGVMGDGNTIFNMELIQELLTEFFKLPKFNHGFVVDTLTSQMIKSPSLVLTTVIRCKPNIWNLHLVLCQGDFTKWALAYEETLRENEIMENSTVSKEYDENEIQEIVKSLQEMTEEEYENASAELKSIYITYGLEERRRKYCTRRRDDDQKVTERSSKHQIQSLERTESKKKLKKEDSKGKSTAEYQNMLNKYNDYTKNTYEQLVCMANNWIFEESDLGYPLYALNGQLLGATQKKSKKKSDTQLHENKTEPTYCDRGFPLLLVTCPCIRYREAIINMFTNMPETKKALEQHQDRDILKCPVIRKEYTVLLPRVFPTITHEEPLKWYTLDEQPIKKCECNQITELSLLDDSSQDNVINILSKWHCTCGKKMTSSQTSSSELPISYHDKEITAYTSSNDFYPSPKPLHSANATIDNEKRIILNPGDLVRCKFSFSPQAEGTFAINRFVEVSGWPESRTTIHVSGICDLPRLDSRLKKMFVNFTRKTNDDQVYKHTYLDDLKRFEFGPIFVGANRIYEEDYSIDLKNSSLITADINIEFLEDSSVFEMDKKFIRLESGCRGKLIITAAPSHVGVHHNVILFCIKDNPEIITVNIGSSGVVPVVEILPLNKLIEYGKLLLYRRAEDRFIIKNDSILPIMWKIRNSKEFIEDFIIGQTSGVVASNGNQVILVTYIASSVKVIIKKPLIIDICDAEGRGNPMLVDTLYLSAECYDVMVECAHENPTETFLNYGNVKVNSTVIREMYLLNRGKYNIFYKLKKVKSFPEPSLLKTFEATPECGLVPASLKLIPIEFECTPSTSMNLNNVPAYICTLLDGNKDQVVVAKFPVNVTIASFYNTFTLFPLGELNFNIIAVGSGVTREVILNNTSKCPFTYEIILPEKYQSDVNSPPIPISAKLKDNKIKNPPLRCGNFMIMNEDNLLAPGTSRTIQMQFVATSARKFEETVKFVVSDTCPAEVSGVPLKLVGIGAMPTLEFWNIENTFREHLIVKNLNEYNLPEPIPHCVFVENSATLHFYSVIINTNYTAYIDLYNNGLVASALTMKLDYQNNTNHEIFSLDKYETHIQPLMHKRLGIIFSPRGLVEYRAALEIKLKLLGKEEQFFRICLIGEGVIPRIKILTPSMGQEKIAGVKFPVTCLGSITARSIRLKNITSIKCTVVVKILHLTQENRLLFWLTAADDTTHGMTLEGKNEMNSSIKLIMKPNEIATLNVHFNPAQRGKTNCDVRIKIVDNPFEYYTVLCEGEAFMEDVILVGLRLLPLDVDIDVLKSSEGTMSTVSTKDTKKRRSVQQQKNERKRKFSAKSSMKQSDSSSIELSSLKYDLDFGGCELCSLQKRCVVMVNNSDKVYKFRWCEVENVIIKPSTGCISPGEEKDLEIVYFAALPGTISKEPLTCYLSAISIDEFTSDAKGTTWDNRQIITVFNHAKDLSTNMRCEQILDEAAIMPSSEIEIACLSIIILYSATTEYIRYKCDLEEEINLKDTYIYQTRSFNFDVENIGKVPIKITWAFQIEDQFPARIDKHVTKEKAPNPSIEDLQDGSIANEVVETTGGEALTSEKRETSKETLFSGNIDRASADTWFEVELPFRIQPEKYCIKPKESQKFTVTFAPLEAFDYKIRLRSSIDNLDPYEQNISCKISAKSLVPYVHLNIEDSDYLTSGWRKETKVALPKNITILEFNVLGSGCYKKKFDVINPTGEGYEFLFQNQQSVNCDLIPVHCSILKGFVEGGTSTEITFSFLPTAPGVYESLWKFLVRSHNIDINILVVGIVREPDVYFVPTILTITNSLVGFKTTNKIAIKNNEDENVGYEFKGDSLCNESGKTPVIVEPKKGMLKRKSETPIEINYTPLQDVPLAFKIFCGVQYMTKHLTLCVNALSHSIKPTVTYYIIGNKHVLSSEAITNIHLEQTASTYERKIVFFIKNDGSATFFFDWSYSTSAVKKYLNVEVEPKSGRVSPEKEIECILHFTLKQIPVHRFPVNLSISDGPVYNILLHAEIKKPSYHFTCMEYDFGKCFVNAPDNTYKKSIAFVNDDHEAVLMDLNFTNLPEIFVDYRREHQIEPKNKQRITIYFRPKEVKRYEFQLPFMVNSLCEEFVTIKGEGIPLLFDIYEGCQKSFDLGAVKVGDKVIRQVEVMNHSSIAIEASFIFRDVYTKVEDTSGSETTSVCLSPGAGNLNNDIGANRVQQLQKYKNDLSLEKIPIDTKNALASLKVVPSIYSIKPHTKVTLKIHFKPTEIISKLDVQLNMRVLEYERPLVKLSGSATGMSLCFSQNFLQFGRVRKRGCKVLKVMLMNKGGFDARFWWQPLKSYEFTISPQYGHIAARSNVTFTIAFRPMNHNPFIKIWASCNIENYMPLEIEMFASCMDVGNMQNKTLYLECPVRSARTEYVVVTNPSDEEWFVLSEVSGGPFETLKEFHVEPNSTFEIPVHFKPKHIGKHEGQVLFAPLGEAALFVTLVGSAFHPNPTDNVTITVPAKEKHTEELLVHNITEEPENYIVITELLKIVPDKFDGFYDIEHPETIKVWGEASATCRWSCTCYEECELQFKVMFVNDVSREYQFYNITVRVTPSKIVDTVRFEARARETVEQTLIVSNPLSQDANFHIMCDKLKSVDQVNIRRKSKTAVTLAFTPLIVGESEETLMVSNELAGIFQYRVLLKCIPAKEKNLEYTIPLGTSIPIRLRVNNMTDVATDFVATVTHPSIILDKDYKLDAHQKGKFVVWFEPTDLGVQNCKVSFNSTVAGEFIFNIKGIAIEPKPQGPYQIRAGSFATIPFKNVFSDTVVFKISTGREEFSVKTQFETLKSKKDTKFAVYLGEQPTGGWKDLPASCLIIECYDPPKYKVQWIYFLQAIP